LEPPGRKVLKGFKAPRESRGRQALPEPQEQKVPRDFRDRQEPPGQWEPLVQPESPEPPEQKALRVFQE